MMSKDFTEKIQDTFGGLSAQSFQLVIASYHPRSYQALIKFQDANRAWAIGIDEDPAVAMGKAVKAAKKQSKGHPPLSAEYFHRDKPRAERVARKLEKKYVPHTVRAVRVQFEPYKGFLCVIFVDPEQDTKELRKKMALVGEVRLTPSGRERNPGKGEAEVKKGGKSSSKQGPSKTSGGGDTLETMNGRELRNEFVRRHGKQPNSRVIKGVEALRQYLLNEGAN